MKKKIYTLIAALCIMIALTGCFEVTEEIWHNPNGSGRMAIDVGMTEEFLSFVESDGSSSFGESWKELADTPSSNPNVEKVEVNEFVKDGMHHFTADFKIKSFEQAITPGLLGDSTDGMDLNIKKLPNGNYKFSQVLNMGTGSEMGDPSTGAMFASMMKDRYWTVRLHVPTAVSSDERGKTDANTIEWKIPMTELVSSTEPIEIWAEYKAQSTLLSGISKSVLVGLGALCLVVLLIGGGLAAVFVLRRRPQPVTVDPYHQSPYGQPPYAQPTGNPPQYYQQPPNNPASGQGYPQGTNSQQPPTQYSPYAQQPPDAQRPPYNPPPGS